mmetsp:Transcript_121380/g.348789  ORF Transcript_121380/g.348789 Transcript_121380/m.348789 type:complete len:451 (-) Transcript_121380:2-1354(-)
MRLRVVAVARDQSSLLHVFVADLEEDESVDQGQKDRGTVTSAESALVSDGVPRLPPAERDELRAEALALRDAGQRRLALGLERLALLALVGPPSDDLADALVVVRLNAEKHEIRRIVILGADHVELRKMGADVMRRALVGHLAFHEEDCLVEQVQDLRARLVDRAKHRAVHLRQLLQHRDHVVCRAGVQAARWLIEERDLRVCDQLRPHGCALAFATRNALDELVADERVGAFGEAHAPEQVVDQAVDGCAVPAQAQAGRELQHLPRGHRPQKGVVLHDVAEQLLVVGGLNRLAVHFDLPGNYCAAAPALANAAGEDVQQAGFPATRRSQDARKLTRTQIACDALQNFFAAGFGCHREAEALPFKRRCGLVFVDEGENLHLGLARSVGRERRRAGHLHRLHFLLSRLGRRSLAWRRVLGHGPALDCHDGDQKAFGAARGTSSSLTGSLQT